MAIANLEYGSVVTLARRYRCGLKYAAIISIASIPYTYLTCPVCQWPNRGQLTVVQWDQRFKNYIDRRYGWYEGAQYTFWETLTQYPEIDRLRAELSVTEREIVKYQQDVVREFTTTGKRTK